ncbi:MAG: ATP-grasp domain-containing protein [Gammaproteobacteria bacterium]|mgnify:FL=1|nr:ATP-grasp domain-containing protein [Gammaproteobacteria bacterium]MBT5643925.1 ATP-grasp domain-containing protein [Gammaproteobacteria bacterium]MBT5863233.1 ATP-grasp domain-containing protein [Gammaproteobacteria bacterium]MBT6734597.1 ATP-grasp domain-containing protein [Gammaproteobacteria bacterium]MBT7236779.1 ATP-grasp domain-containing protein [Gammaproteobacteria bacterium]
MIDAVVVINSDSSYLEDKFISLGIKVFAFDYYNHNNLGKIKDIAYLKSFIDKIFIDHQSVGLLYGSGLEDKSEVYDYLNTKLKILGNDPHILSRCNDLRLLKEVLGECSLELPNHTENPISLKKRYLSKPFNSSGGHNITFEKNFKKNFYFQEYLPGITYSISFFNHEGNFIFLGFNKLFNLINYQPHPFIHAGGTMTDELKNFDNIISSFKKLSNKLSMNGYNSIDFKVINEKVFILDINPRITSTFNMYNDIYNNDLLRLMVNYDHYKEHEPSNKIGAFVHMFIKQKYIFKNIFENDSSFVNLPVEGQLIDENEPLLSIYVNSLSKLELMTKLKEKISMTTNLYNCYDIDI